MNDDGRRSRSAVLRGTRPLPNRVTPFGDVVAIAQRGMFTGNRGIIHDPATKTLLGRRWTTKAWLICSCSYGSVRRDVMARRSWTELFFLDEAIALAAGHRPCFLCRREAAEAFRNAWIAGSGLAKPSAAQMDAILHRERLSQRRKRLHPLPSPLAGLPDGTVVTKAGAAFTLLSGRAVRWTPSGYAPAETLRDADALLTPPSTYMALKSGYAPVLHPSSVAGPRHLAHDAAKVFAVFGHEHTEG